MQDTSKPAVKSNRGGRRAGAGRPPSAKVYSRRQAHRMAVNNAHLVSIIKTQIELAIEGDLAAAKFIMDGLFGKETPAAARYYSINSETDLRSNEGLCGVPIKGE